MLITVVEIVYKISVNLEHKFIIGAHLINIIVL